MKESPKKSAMCAHTAFSILKQHTYKLTDRMSKHTKNS